MKNTQQALILFMVFVLISSSGTTAFRPGGPPSCGSVSDCSEFCTDCGYCDCSAGVCVRSQCFDSGFEGMRSGVRPNGDLRRCKKSSDCTPFCKGCVACGCVGGECYSDHCPVKNS
ncbi:hypothetical protein L1987_10923 [Smallanthus sonchifolius]|uniref:Uncharacterized protein n=1 Tax=Smallanthus sonchifolius TaxID=185202 RepID=A0ACB9J9H0_9ASTR|nr:hypothetical protein L1987_10923 [Smallanthus sonchifolius]